MEALLNDKVEFVQLFLDNGIHWKTFVTHECLNKLYGQSLIDKSNTIVTTLEKFNKRIEVKKCYNLAQTGAGVGLGLNWNCIRVFGGEELDWGYTVYSRYKGSTIKYYKDTKIPEKNEQN